MNMTKLYISILSIIPFFACAGQGEEKERSMVNGERFFYDSDSYITYRKNGDGPSNVIFLHGFGASKGVWFLVENHLENTSHTFYFVDLKGHGFSVIGQDKKFTLFDYATVIKSFIKEKEIINPIFVGHSFGGTVALLITILTEDDIDITPRSLVLIDSPAYEIELPFFVSYLRYSLVPQILDLILSEEQQSRHALQRLYYDKSKITTDIVRNYSDPLKRSDVKQALKMTARQINPSDYTKYETAYKELDLPVAILWGENDNIISQDIGRRLHDALPNSEMNIIPQSGHNVHEEQAEHLATLINKHIRD